MTRVEGDKCALDGLSFLRAWYPNLQTLVPFNMEPKAPLPILSFSSESLDLPLSPSLILETTQNSSPSQQDEAVAGGYGAGGSVLDAPVGDQVDAESFLLGPLAHAGVMLSVKPSVTRQHRQSAPPTSSTSAPSVSRQASAPSFFAPLGPPSYEPKGDVALPFVDVLLLPLLEAYARSMTTVSLGADAEQDNSADDHDNDRHRHHTQLHLAFDLAQNFAAAPATQAALAMGMERLTVRTARVLHQAVKRFSSPSSCIFHAAHAAPSLTVAEASKQQKGLSCEQLSHVLEAVLDILWWATTTARYQGHGKRRALERVKKNIDSNSNCGMATSVMYAEVVARCARQLEPPEAAALLFRNETNPVPTSVSPTTTPSLSSTSQGGNACADKSVADVPLLVLSPFCRPTQARSVAGVMRSCISHHCHRTAATLLPLLLTIAPATATDVTTTLLPLPRPIDHGVARRYKHPAEALDLFLACLDAGCDAPPFQTTCFLAHGEQAQPLIAPATTTQTQTQTKLEDVKKTRSQRGGGCWEKRLVWDIWSFLCRLEEQRDQYEDDDRVVHENSGRRIASQKHKEERMVMSATELPLKLLDFGDGRIAVAAVCSAATTTTATPSVVSTVVSPSLSVNWSGELSEGHLLVSATEALTLSVLRHLGAGRVYAATRPFRTARTMALIGGVPSPDTSTAASSTATAASSGSVGVEEEEGDRGQEEVAKTAMSSSLLLQGLLPCGARVAWAAPVRQRLVFAFTTLEDTFALSRIHRSTHMRNEGEEPVPTLQPTFSSFGESSRGYRTASRFIPPVVSTLPADVSSELRLLLDVAEASGCDTWHLAAATALRDRRSVMRWVKNKNATCSPNNDAASAANTAAAALAAACGTQIDGGGSACPQPVGLEDYVEVIEVLAAELTGSHWKETLLWGERVAVEIKAMDLDL